MTCVHIMMPVHNRVCHTGPNTECLSHHSSDISPSAASFLMFSPTTLYVKAGEEKKGDTCGHLSYNL